MTLNYNNIETEVPDGADFLSLAKRVRGDYDAPIILAKLDQKLFELTKPVPAQSRGPRRLSFITTRDRDGHKTYERGATMMFLRAARNVLKKSVDVRLEYAVGDALYFSVTPDTAFTDADCESIRAAMRRYADADEPFIKTKQPTDEVIALFRQHGMKDKERLFHYRRASVTNIYKFGNYCDYYYGYMPPSAGYIGIFDVKRTVGGALLILPNKAEPEKPGSAVMPEKLFATMRSTNTWCRNIGVSTVAELNDAISAGRGREIILASEAHQEHLIGEIARQIKEENRRIVMIAGPSSSGKTSFSHRLCIQLGNMGLHSYPIACDDYYVERSLTPRDETGDYDFECLEAIDVELFNKQMSALLRGESVDLPHFNFRTGKPEYSGCPMSVGKNDVLVIEGIHGLNDKLSYAISPDDKFKIYISAVTTLNVDEHNRIPTTDNREIRRMVRDARTRGFTATDTISRWMSVRKGEHKHIFPFQEQADVMFNSASLYELAVLKTFAEPLLFSIPTDAPEYPEAKRLLKFLEYFLGLSCEDVPRNSLIREFIGGSIFPVG